jgi:hypothetical protein
MCEGCKVGWHPAQSVKSKTDRVIEKVGEMTMMDSTGPFPLPFIFTDGHRYIHALIDVCSLHMRMMTTLSKKDAGYALERYSQLLPKGISMQGGIVRFDGAGENRAGALRVVEKLGCTPEFIAPHRSQQLGLLEKRLADCKHKGKTMLIDAGIHLGEGRRLLGEATRHSIHIKNDSVSRQLMEKVNSKTPLTPRMVFEGINYKPKRTYNIPFGAVCVCHTKIENATLSKGNGIPALYMGMAEFHPEGTARCYNPVTKRLLFSQDFEVEPTMFLRDSRVIPPEVILAHTTGDGLPEDLTDVDISLLDEPEGVVDDLGLASAPVIPPSVAIVDPDGVGAVPRNNIRIYDDVSIDIPMIHDAHIIPDKDVPGTIADDHHDLTTQPSAPADLPASGKAERKESKKQRRSERVAARSGTILLVQRRPSTWKQGIPLNCHQARRHADSGWWEAAEMEMNGHIHDRDTYSVLDWSAMPPGRKPIRTMMIFTTKRSGKKKARWVVRGDQQVYGVDYWETSSPTLKWDTFLILMWMSIKRGYVLRSMDAVQAFVQSDIDGDVYLYPLDGYHDLPGKVLKLKKCLYGLHQSSRQWYKKVEAFLTRDGFTQSACDPCLWWKHGADPNHKLFVAHFVDDFLILFHPDDRETLFDPFKASAQKEFDLTFEDADPEDYLGGEIDIADDGEFVQISQGSMIRRFLEEEGFAPGKCAPTDTPAVPGTMLKKSTESDVRCDIDKYQSRVGALTYYSTRTRWDVRNAVRELGQQSCDPNLIHWEASNHVLRFLSGDPDRGLVFWRCEVEDDDNIFWYVDSSFAPGAKFFPLIKPVSVTGITFNMGGVAVMARSYKQSHVTTSTMESEVDALHDAVLHAIYYKAFLLELCIISLDFVFYMMEDNQAAICFSEEEWIKESSKHIHIRYGRVKECVKEGFIRALGVASKDQGADILTKNVSAVLLERLSEKIMGRRVPKDWIQRLKSGNKRRYNQPSGVTTGLLG